MNYSEKLKSLRKSLKLSQSLMANKIGIKQAYYSELERGDKAISGNVLKMLVSECNVNPEWLYNDKGEMLIIANSNNSAVEINVDFIEFDFMQRKLTSLLKENKDLIDIYRSALEIAEFEYNYKKFYKKHLTFNVSFSKERKIDLDENVTALYRQLEQLKPYKNTLKKLANSIKDFYTEMYQLGDEDFAITQLDSILNYNVTADKDLEKDIRIIDYTKGKVNK